MSRESVSQFVDRISEIIPVIMKEFMKYQTTEFYKVKITMPQFVILNFLMRRGGSNMTDMARSANVTTAAMTGIIDRLVKNGYAKRATDPKDRRIIRVKLTSKGDKTIRNILEHRRRVMIKIFGMMSPKDREEYLRILTNIHNRLKKR